MKYGTIVKRRKIIMKKYAEVCSIKNMTFKSIVSFFTILAMVVAALGIQPVQSVRAENNLAAGIYTVLITPSEWEHGAPMSSKCIDISDRIAVFADGEGNDHIALTINGYSKYEAIYMVKQDKNDVIDVLCGSVDYIVDSPENNKIGTNWTSFDDNPLTAYDKLDEYKDENLNDCFVKLDKPEPEYINEKTDTATFVIQNVDIDKKIGLIGYTGKFQKGHLLPHMITHIIM